ncbi:protein phosphatase 2C domain-containing protein [Streptomyces ochraceiscleroticus]|uniref:Protein phosphatase 2C domain-containing protein n=1 Tax=Streptomyces ochraceiscleroticus TaxID=47761 RepID=A0ABW1MU40_9ACTN|nr:protein phosphatase 2C domain-containing protein [Streptomyces ochraceiscleroticus]
MSQQGDTRGHEDDWWRELYEAGDGKPGDAGPSTAPDTLDDRVDSALRTLDAAVAPEAADAFEAADEADAPEPPVPVVEFIGDRPPTYAAEPVALPAADPADLAGLVPDTELDGAQYGTLTLRAASVRGDSARYRGDPRRDALLTARFGAGRQTLILIAVASGAHASPEGHRAARDACQWIGAAVGRSGSRLADDIRTGRREALRSGLQRLTDRSYGRLRARAAELGLDPREYTASLRCLLLPADPACRTRVFFGLGGGGLFRLRDGVWQDLEPPLPPDEAVGGPVVGYGTQSPGIPAQRGPAGPEPTAQDPEPTMNLGVTGAPGATPEAAPEPVGEPFLFRASVARSGDTLLLCSAGLAEPLRETPDFAARLAGRWAETEPPGLAAFLADAQLRVKGHAKDRTAAAVWES